MQKARTGLLQRLSRHSHAQDLGLYIHIPFCQKRCHFCAFYLTTHRESRVQEFLSALFQEIDFYTKEAACSHVPISTIYFGGGTPTSLQSEQLVEILDHIRRQFTLSPSLEITVEADPGTTSQSSLQMLYEAEVNRLSFGVQSLEESEWTQLGRSGELHMVNQAIQMAKDIGFSNIGIDLMYGLPGQTLKSWQYSLEQVIAFGPMHVSCYALTIEEGTQFHRSQAKGVMSQNDLALEASMHEQACAYLDSFGYLQYEVSNFSRPGFECRHNLRYWSGLEYLGLGPSAQSYMANMRFGNVEDLSAYVNLLDRQKLPIDNVDCLSSLEAEREQVIFGLRLNRGVPVRAIAHLEENHAWRATLRKMMDSGLLVRDQENLKATARGREFMDMIALELL